MAVERGCAFPPALFKQPPLGPASASLSRTEPANAHRTTAQHGPVLQRHLSTNHDVKKGHEVLEALQTELYQTNHKARCTTALLCRSRRACGRDRST